jgi:hypothetical protein
MKERLKINFVDFWPNFFKTDNYFYHLLSTEFDVLIDENEPDILFHSVSYSNEQNHRKYDNKKTVKVFYTGENQRPNYDETHFSFSFDFSPLDEDRNYRLPLWALYLNWFDVPDNEERDQSYLHPLDDFLDKKIDPDEIRKTKKNFCAFISSVPKGKRVDFVPKLHQYKPVACGGKLLNNIGGVISGRGDQKWKMKFLESFKFNVSFENTSYPGYVTEKIIQPMFSNAIPIYWGSLNVVNDFNNKSFVNWHDYEDDELVIEKIKHLDNNEDAYLEMLNEPWFKGNKIPDSVKPENVLSFIREKIL